jgi:hypothetical protein
LHFRDRAHRRIFEEGTTMNFLLDPGTSFGINSSTRPRVSDEQLAEESVTPVLAAVDNELTALRATLAAGCAHAEHNRRLYGVVAQPGATGYDEACAINLVVQQITKLEGRREYLRQALIGLTGVDPDAE